MNERITDLHNQAIIFSGKNGGLRISSHIPNDYIEKFTELIVRECAQVCLSQRDPANLNYKPSERFAEAVKQHFGVEK